MRNNNNLHRASSQRKRAPKDANGPKASKIVVPTDFSSLSDSALEYAQFFANHADSEILLMHVIDISYYGAEVAHQYVDLVQLRRDAETQLRQMQQTIREAHSETCVVEGTPFRAIIEKAESTGADLIVMGSHGYSGLKRLFLGSTAERVVRHAKCPVLVVRTPKSSKALARTGPIRTAMRPLHPNVNMV